MFIILDGLLTTRALIPSFPSPKIQDYDSPICSNKIFNSRTFDDSRLFRENRT